MEHKLGTLAMAMGGLGLMEIQDDAHQGPQMHLFGPSVSNSNTIRHYTVFNNAPAFPFRNQSIIG